MRKMMIAMIALLLMSGISGCVGNDTTDVGQTPLPENTVFSDASEVDEKVDDPVSGKEEEGSDMNMKIGDTFVQVVWEDNESVEALRELVSESPLTIQMSMYGNFEQVGSIGQSLPSDDVHITAKAGDIVLYSGNQMVVFYGSNSWSYTRLGHISDFSKSELKELLGNGDVSVTIGYPSD